MHTPIYLDYAATTPVDPRVANVMATYLTIDGQFGNPASTTHSFGYQAKNAVDNARQQVAQLLNAEASEIIWTSGATESNNLAIKGAAYQYRSRGRHIITCKTEHKAVLDVCRALEQEGFAITYLDPQCDGLIDLADLEAALRPDTLLVSIMHVNNETGVVQDIHAISQLTRSRGVLFHVDAAQSAGKVPLDVKLSDLDLVSVCAHKIYGPKGIGALYIRRKPRLPLQALLHGGGQQRGLRAGTLPTHQIVAMGSAFELAAAQQADDDQRIMQLRQKLWQGLQQLPEVYLNGHATQTVSGILNVSFNGIVGEALLMALSNIAVASGSACTSATQEPSHVLRAMGHSDQRADSAIRFSLGRYTSAEQIDYVIGTVSAAVSRLRELSPLWPEPVQVEPVQAEPLQAEPLQAEPLQAEPLQVVEPDR